MTNPTTHRLLGSALVAAALLSSAAAFAQGDPSAAPSYRLPRARPLTVTRQAPVVVAPVYAPGPGIIVTGPLGVASTLVSIPFRIGNAIFPANAPPPVNLVGMPIAAAGAIAQVPFQVVSAPFGGLPPR